MMKRFTLALVGVASVATLSAQRPANGGQTLPSPARYVLTGEKADSTLLPASILSGNCDSLYLINALTASGADSVPGYVFGINGYLDISKGYMFNGTGSLTGLGASIADKFLVDTTSTGGYYFAKVYSSTGTLLGTSDSVLYDSISTTPSGQLPIPITAFTFSTPVSVSGDFLVMIDAYSEPDTVLLSGIGMLSNGYACGDDRSYERFVGQSGEVNSKISSYWTRPGTALDLLADPFIAVQIQGFLGETQVLTPHSLMAYPNPASGQTTVSFGSQTHGTAQIEVRNLAGQLVMETSADVMHGRNEVNLNLSNVGAGIYMYQVKVGADVQTGKLVVNP